MKEKSIFLLKLASAWKLFELSAKKIMLECKVAKIHQVLDVYGEIHKGDSIERIAIEIEFSNFLQSRKHWNEMLKTLRKVGIQRLIVVSPVRPKSEMVEWWNASDLLREFLFFVNYVREIMDLWYKLDSDNRTNL